MSRFQYFGVQWVSRWRQLASYDVIDHHLIRWDKENDGDDDDDDDDDRTMAEATTTMTMTIIKISRWTWLCDDIEDDDFHDDNEDDGETMTFQTSNTEGIMDVSTWKSYLCCFLLQDLLENSEEVHPRSSEMVAVSSLPDEPVREVCFVPSKLHRCWRLSSKWPGR